MAKAVIVTRRGDGGRTRLFSGEEVSKHSPRPEACGDIDELVSLLGLARLHCRHRAVVEAVRDVQRQLFVAAAEMATEAEQQGKLARRVDAEYLNALDAQCERLLHEVALPQGLVLPGDDLGSAHLHVARAVARRCERRAVGLRDSGLLDNADLIRWLNRLSDYLYLLALAESGAATPA